MSLDSIAIKRLPYEDTRYSDTEIVEFRRLFNLSMGTKEDKAQFKKEVSALAISSRPAVQKLTGFIKDVDLYKKSLNARQEQVNARQEQVNKKQEENIAEGKRLNAELAQAHSNIKGLDERLAALEIKENALLNQFGADLGRTLQNTFSAGSQATVSTSRVNTAYK